MLSAARVEHCVRQTVCPADLRTIVRRIEVHTIEAHTIEIHAIEVHMIEVQSRTQNSKKAFQS